MIKTLTEAPHPFKGTEIHTLSNGLQLILRNDPTVPVVALQAWARCGAIDETPSIYGISHGLEHMVFKGTPSRSAGEITRAIESKGGSMNAATQLETTHYYIDIPSYGLKPALDVLADTILHPIFPQDELERERLVILEEIHRRDDSPDATLWDEFAAHIFKDTPYGIKVIGNHKTVSEMSREDLESYYATNYVPGNMNLVIVGDFNKNKILKQLHDLFDEQPFRKMPSTPVIDFPADSVASNVTVKKPVQLSYFAVGIPTVGLNSPDIVALDVLADVFGGGASARFYQRLREEQQVMLSVSCDYVSFQQKGIFAVFGETLPNKADEAQKRLMDEIANLAKNPVQPAELARAKARIKSEWLHGSETPHGQASTLGSLNILGQTNLINTYLAQIETLTVDDLMQAYRTYVENRPFYGTFIVPNKAAS